MVEDWSPINPYGEDPHMWSYWSDKYYRLEDALEEYYPKTLEAIEELRILYYVYKATSDKAIASRIHEIMGERERIWEDWLSD